MTLMRPSLGILVLCTVSGVLAAPASQPSAEQYSDETKTFTIEAPSPWIPVPKSPNPKIVSMLTHGTPKRGSLAPSVVVMKISSNSHLVLDDVARAMLDKAKREHPDQAGIDKIERSRLGGQEARRVSYLLGAGGRTLRVVSLVTLRGKFTYVLQFFAAEDEFEKQAEAGQSVMNTFHWVE